MRIIVTLCGVVATLCVVAALTNAQDEPKRKKAGKGTVHVVKMTNVGGTNKFDPDDLPNVKVGDQVKFVNEGGTHTATSDDIKTGDPKKTFNTGTMKKGQETVINFNDEASITYHCEYHPGMTGKITVKK